MKLPSVDELKSVAGVAGIVGVGGLVAYLTYRFGGKKLSNAIENSQNLDQVKNDLQDKIAEGVANGSMTIDKLLVLKKQTEEVITKAKSVGWPLNGTTEWKNFISAQEARLEIIKKNLKAVGY